MATPNYAWQITRQEADQTRNDASGNVQIGSNIYFTTGQGNQGVVFVPDNLLTINHVKATVRAAAKLMDDIGVLSEGSFQQ